MARRRRVVGQVTQADRHGGPHTLAGTLHVGGLPRLTFDRLPRSRLEKAKGTSSARQGSVQLTCPTCRTSAGRFRHVPMDTGKQLT